MNQKALSPLSSTLLLLGISIVIGIIVMTWGRSYVERATSVSQVTAEPSIFQDLDERLARGEITQEQHDKIKKVLIEQNTG